MNLDHWKLTMSRLQLLKHLDPKDTSHLSKLYSKTQNYGEVKRLIYRNLYNGIVNGMDEMHVDLEKIAFYKQKQLLGQSDIAPFQARTNTTFVKEFSEILQGDPVVSAHLDVVQHTTKKIVVNLRQDEVTDQ